MASRVRRGDVPLTEFLSTTVQVLLKNPNASLFAAPVDVSQFPVPSPYNTLNAMTTKALTVVLAARTTPM